MRKKADSKQVKVNKVLRASAVAASVSLAIREPPPDTWPVKMPAYAYTSLCPNPELRRPPMRKERSMETVRPVEVHKICLKCRKRYPIKEARCSCGGWLYVTGLYRSCMAPGRKE
ncbi:MAG: hypothetical protein LUK37_23065 [Clostridia bacterium]|nr:hypothetical protein [Clostridia bacterium]